MTGVQTCALPIYPHRDYILSVLNQVPPIEDESRYIPVQHAQPQNDCPKEDGHDHAIAYGHGVHPKPYDYPQPAK